MEFKSIVEKNFNEWKEQSTCQEAVRLNEDIGKEYFDSANPHFFTGDVNSELVLVHLNPKRNKDLWNKECTISSFDEYWDSFAQFGKRNYGIDSTRNHKSPFDHKQIRFLRPFELFPIDNPDKYLNLENVMDRKLQLELVPYGSPDFSYKTIGIENLKPFAERLLSVIDSKKRKYVIFCGKVFQPILKDFIFDQKIHNFKLNKNNGTQTLSDFQVINIKLKTNKGEINACIAPQFAKQGYPEGEYGKKVKELYEIT